MAYKQLFYKSWCYIQCRTEVAYPFKNNKILYNKQNIDNCKGHSKRFNWYKQKKFEHYSGLIEENFNNFVSE